MMAVKETLLLVVSVFPTMGESALYTGEFFSSRSEVRVPNDNVNVFWHCLGGSNLLTARATVFAPGVAFNDVAFDVGDWEDPPNDWNSTINENVTKTDILTMFSIGGGHGCGCITESASFSEFLLSNSRAGSKFAIDMFQGPNIAPYNWFWGSSSVIESPQYLKTNDTWVVETVKTGPPLYTFNYGWQTPESLSLSSELVTYNKFVRIDIPPGKSFALYAATGDVAEPYEFVVDLIKVNPDLTYKQESNSIDKYVTSESDLNGAKKIEFPAASEGHYYFISIRNNKEMEYDTDFKELPYKCSLNNMLNTKNKVTFSIEECNDCSNAATSGKNLFLSLFLVFSLLILC